MRSSLDEFARYLEKKQQVTAEAADVPDVTVSVAATPTLPVQYVLRNGVTIAVPSAKADVPTNQAVAEDTGSIAEQTPTSRAPATEAAPIADVGRAAALWGHLPRHIQLLVSLAHDSGEEAAQKYYSRGFKESRGELIERLLDPTLTLEDTARILGVVPATVRRYTNRGVLPHYRTAGQQRRFRLSDVLAFLELQQLNGGEDGSDADPNICPE